MCVGVHVGRLDLEDVRRHGALRLDAHVLVDDGGRDALAVCLGAAATTAARERVHSIDHF